jgi:hypothetical protein
MTKLVCVNVSLVYRIQQQLNESIEFQTVPAILQHMSVFFTMGGGCIVLIFRNSRVGVICPKLHERI